MRWLLDASGNTRQAQVDEDRQQGREEGGERVVHATVLLDADDLVDDPSNKVHPRKGRGEGEASGDGVQGLRFELLADESNGFSGGRHFIYYS